VKVILVYLPCQLLWNRPLMYGRMGYCLPLLHLCHQHVSICPDVDVRTVTSHMRDSKLNANPSVTLSKRDDAHKCGRAQQMSEILRASRAYENSKIRSNTIFKIYKHDGTQYLRDSISIPINCSTMCYLSSTLSPTFYTFRISGDLSILHFQVQIYTKCNFIHKEQIRSRWRFIFRSSLSTQLVKLLTAS
jgi:hypothetical protein